MAILAVVLPQCQTGRLTPDFEPAARIYNYAPSVIELEGGSRVVYYCTNTTGGLIRDSIGFRRAARSGGRWIWGEERIVLGPSSAGWDEVHVCDPDLVRGKFSYGGTEYRYALFFLGCDTLDVTHNQIGVAFANEPEGPWVRSSANPVIEYGAYDRWWGMGQPSVVNPRRDGEVVLFYTRGDADGTRLLARTVDLSDGEHPVRGPAQTVPTAGLTSIDGSRVIFHNAGFALDSAERPVVVRGRHPFDRSVPEFIASELQVAMYDRTYDDLAGGRWEVIGGVTPGQTGWPRNHNASIVKDEYGRLLDPGRVAIAFSVAHTGPGYLWTYRVAHIQLTLPRPLRAAWSSPGGPGQ